jgi:tRNA(adenine34) deaminase
VTGNILAEEGAGKLKLFFEKRRKTAAKRHADESC